MKHNPSTIAQHMKSTQVLPTSKMFVLGLLLIGAVSSILASAKWGIAFFAWLAPVSLLYFYRLVHVKRKLLWFLPVLIVISIASSFDVAPFPVPVLVILGILEGLKAMIIFLVDKWINKKSNHFLTTLFFPAAYVSMEFLNTKLGGGVWWSVANSQFSFSWLAQMASITGLWGISFLIYWFASVIVWALQSHASGRQYKKGLFIYGMILFVALLFGAIRYSSDDFQKVKPVRVAGLSVPVF